jgi:hypothetical protein
MYDELKSDIINTAHDKLRISGLTVIAGPEENKRAIFRLENLAREMSNRNICLNYNFEDNPDLSSLHNMKISNVDAVATVLSTRLMPSFGKGFSPDPVLMGQASSAWSYLFTNVDVQNVIYPRRMPLGSGNRLYYFTYDRYYRQAPEAPNECATNDIVIGEINDYVESFASELSDTEAISTYTIEADDGLIIVSSSLDSPNINYRINAEAGQNLFWKRVFITATLDSGRIIKHKINFELRDINAYD